MKQTDRAELAYYRVFEEKAEIEDTGLCTVYGIEAQDESGTVLRVGNISAQRGEAERFAEMCNVFGLSPIHFFEALDNYLADL